MDSRPVASEADATTLTVVKDTAARNLDQEMARCQAAIAAAEESVQRSQAALATAEQLLRRAQDLQKRFRELLDHQITGGMSIADNDHYQQVRDDTNR